MPFFRQKHKKIEITKFFNHVISILNNDIKAYRKPVILINSRYIDFQYEAKKAPRQYQH